MTYINSFDKKLADGFDNNIDFDTIIASMDDDEIYEMWDFLEGEIGRDYSYTTFKEAKVLICEDYVCEIAAQAIRDMKLPRHEVMEIARAGL